MASVQERLQLKRLPLDNWTVSEKLYLASAVASGGDQNWMSVSRSLKIICGTNRPHDWFSQKSCAAQYGKLLESVETPKRKKRNEKDANQSTVDTPIELIVRKLTQERIAVLEKCIQEEREEYAKIKEEIAAIENDQVDEQQLRDWWAEIENEEMRFEKEQQKHAQWLKVNNIYLEFIELGRMEMGAEFLSAQFCRNVKSESVKWNARGDQMHSNISKDRRRSHHQNHPNWK